MKLYYSLKEVCEMVGMSMSTINRAVDANQLKCARVKIGKAKMVGKTLFKKEWIEEWLDPKERE